MMEGRQGWWSIRRRAVKLLEEADVENIVQMSPGRKAEADSDVVDELDDVVRSVEAWLELAGAGLRQGRCCTLP
jgi:hypothetical protein